VDRGEDGAPGFYNNFWLDGGTSPVETRRTSLIVDPPNGRKPAMTAASQQRQAAIARERQGIGMHADHRDFGPVVASLSLGTSWPMRFRRCGAGHSIRTGQPGDEVVSLPRRSILVLAGAARRDWMHGIDPADPGGHVLQEAHRAGNVDEGDAAPRRQTGAGEAEIDGEASGLLLLEPVGVGAGERLHEGGLAVVDVACGGDYVHRLPVCSILSVPAGPVCAGR